MAKRRSKKISVSTVGSKYKKGIYKKYVFVPEEFVMPEVPAQFKEANEKLNAVGLFMHCTERDMEVGKRWMVGINKRVPKTVRSHCIWATGTWNVFADFKIENFYTSVAWKEHKEKGYSPI